MIETLFQNNKDWAQRKLAKDPHFFDRLLTQQHPKYLWIGCSDSRVPANQIIGLAPGEIFVHRNVANLVVHSDLNCLSVLQFAIDLLQVEHIMVTGHYGCGGVATAMNKRKIGLSNNWLHHINDVAERHERQLLAVTDDERLNRLCEFNVIEQAVNVTRTTIVQDAWQRGQKLEIHAWIYGLHDGILRDLQCSIRQESDRIEVYRHAIAQLSRAETQ